MYVDVLYLSFSRDATNANGHTYMVTCTISDLLDIRRVLSYVNLREHPPRHASTLQDTRSGSLHLSAGALVRANRCGTPADG